MLVDVKRRFFGPRQDDSTVQGVAHAGPNIAPMTTKVAEATEGYVDTTWFGAQAMTRALKGSSYAAVSTYIWLGAMQITVG